MKKIIIIVVIVVAVLGGAGAGFWFVTSRPVSTKVVVLPTFAVEFEESFITDIYKSSKLLKADVAIECTNKKFSVKMTEEVDKVRDIIVSTFRNKTETELKGVENEKHLKEELIKRINAEFKTTYVSEVFFSNFVIQ